MVVPLGSARADQLDRRIDEFISPKKNIFEEDIGNSFNRFVIRIIRLKCLPFRSTDMAWQLIESQPKRSKNKRTILLESLQSPNSINKKRSIMIMQKPHLGHPLHMLLTANQFKVRLKFSLWSNPQIVH